MTLPPLRKALAAVVMLLCIAYSNHFHNDFHFDDSHTVIENPWIRDTGNIPKFFTDGTTFSSLPANRTYRPIVTTSLAIDYWLGKGLKPLWFHISTFFWYLLQLALMFLLFRRLGGEWIALAATAIYALHPAMAETVNYVIQRGDIYSTLGVVASLAAYVLAPAQRRYGLYLVPLVLGLLSKPPALVFPVLLCAWLCIIEGERFSASLLRTAPSALTVAATMFFVGRMNPASYNPSSGGAYAYRITQPQVLMEYFRRFFLPTDLTVDTDHNAYTDILHPDVLLGFAFVALVCAAIYGSARVDKTKPVAFGLLWFLVASIPTSVYALAEIENDHRMYFPFVGLSIAVVSAVALWCESRGIGLQIRLGAMALLLAVGAWATYGRNAVWANDENLWLDATLKSPKNGRGLMNYGLTQMAKGNYPRALDYFERALVLTPDYFVLEINLGVAYGATGKLDLAERHFQRALQLAPNEAISHYFYARWLNDVGRRDTALLQAVIAKSLNPDHTAARYLIMQIHQDSAEPEALRLEAEDFLKRFPGDPAATGYLARSRERLIPKGMPPGSAPAAQTPQADTPEAHLDRSMALYQQHRYNECIAEAQLALKLRPNYPEAYNNIAAAYNEMHEWDRGIAAASEAVRIKPDFQLAKNNLAWSLSQKAAGQKK